MKTVFLYLLILTSSLSISAQYQISSKSVVGKKTTITTKYDRGFVVKSDGSRLDGLIKLKIVNNDTVEVRYKNDAKKKFKFKRAQLKNFGLKSLISDNKTSRTAEKNFNSGYIINNNNEKKEGKVALRFVLNPGEAIGRKWFVYKVLFDKGNGEYDTYVAKDLKAVGQNVEGTQNTYVKYKDGFTKQIQKGELELFRNPYSNSENKLANSLIKDVQQDLAEEVAKQTVKSAIKNGKGTLSDAVNNYNAVNSADISIKRKEYLVRKKGTDTFEVLSKKNYKDWSQKIFENCNAFSELEKKGQKKLTKWDNLVEGISFYNNQCK
ncbi:hypothetical protein ACXGQW_11575 [Wenyingzhuangia sp. IMCC45533]